METKPKYLRDRLVTLSSQFLNGPIKRGVLGGLFGTFTATFAVWVVFVSMECPEWSVLFIVLSGIFMGGMGIIIAGLPCVLFSVGIGIAEQYRTLIPKWLLWIWYLIVPAIFSMGAIGVSRYLPSGVTKSLGLPISLLGLAYMLVRVFEIYILKRVLHPLAGTALTTLLYCALHFIAYINVIKSIHPASPLGILLFFIVLFQRIHGGLAASVAGNYIEDNDK